MKKSFILMMLSTVLSFSLFAQWSTPGVSNYTSIPDPRISKANPHIELSSVGTYSGIEFLSGGGPDGWLWYNHTTNELGFSNSQSLTNAAMTIDRDNGYLVLRRINSRIGIGTDSPMDDLHIKTPGFADIRLESNVNSSSRILLYNGATQNGMISQDDEEMHVYNLVPSGIMRLGMDNNDLVILANGNTGIGTTNPTEKLEVNGGIKLGSTINDNPGTLRWTGSDLEGRTNDGWETLTPTDSPWTEDGSDIFRMAGNVGIGVDTPSFKLHVNGNTHITGELTTTSDRNLKENIIPIEDALEIVRRLNPVQYSYRTEEFTELNLSEGDRLGLIAQEVRDILPQLVSEAGTINLDGEESKYLGVNYIELIPLLIKGVQELNDQNQVKDKIISDLQSEIALLSGLEKRLDYIEAQMNVSNN